MYNSSDGGGLHRVKYSIFPQLPAIAVQNAALGESNERAGPRSRGRIVVLRYVPDKIGGNRRGTVYGKFEYDRTELVRSIINDTYARVISFFFRRSVAEFCFTTFFA